MEYLFRTSERHQNSHFQSNIQSSRLNFAPSAYRNCALPVPQAEDNFEKLNGSLGIPDAMRGKGPSSNVINLGGGGNIAKSRATVPKDK